LPGGGRTRVLPISFIFSFSPLYRWATAATQEHELCCKIHICRPMLMQCYEMLRSFTLLGLFWSSPVLSILCVLVNSFVLSSCIKRCPAIVNTFSRWIEFVQFGPTLNPATFTNNFLSSDPKLVGLHKIRSGDKNWKTSIFVSDQIFCRQTKFLCPPT
jgi:hypothetical protein